MKLALLVCTRAGYEIQTKPNRKGHAWYLSYGWAIGKPLYLISYMSGSMPRKKSICTINNTKYINIYSIVINIWTSA